MQFLIDNDWTLGEAAARGRGRRGVAVHRTDPRPARVVGGSDAPTGPAGMRYRSPGVLAGNCDTSTPTLSAVFSIRDCSSACATG